MNKETYLRYLRALLSGRLPDPELEDILRYYDEYITEAGPEQEAAIFTELGSPEQLAHQILQERVNNTPALLSPEASGKIYEKKSRRAPELWKILLGFAAAVFVVQRVPMLLSLASANENTAASEPIVSIAEEDDVGVQKGTAVTEATYASVQEMDAEALEQASIVKVENSEITWLETDKAMGGGMQIDFQSGLKELDVHVELGNIIVQEGDSYRASLDWDDDSYRIFYEYDPASGSLYIGSEGDTSSVNASADILITVPKNSSLENASLTTETGDIFWMASGNFQEIQIYTFCGDISWNTSAEAQNVYLQSDNGDVTWNGRSVETCNLYTEVGDISISLPAFDGLEYSLQTDLGQVSVNGKPHGTSVSNYMDGSQTSDMDAYASLGDISLQWKN